MNFSAVISADQREAANDTLAAKGWGRNFKIPSYTGPRPSHAALHAYNDAAFQAAVEALPGVTVSSIAGSPADRVADALSTIGSQWGDNAPPLEGEVTPGLYREGDRLVWVIQAFNRDTFPNPIEEIPALVRFARTPGEVLPWVQPIDQFDAYLLKDPFTGEPERAKHVGTEWETTIDFNVNEPGTQNSGWVDLNPPEPGDLPDRWVQGGGTGTAGSYNAGDLVVHDRPQDGGNDWVFRSNIDANTTEPSRDSTFDRWWEPLDRVEDWTP